MMSNAATTAGYASNILVLKDGFYSGKLLHGASEVLHPLTSTPVHLSVQL